MARRETRDERREVLSPWSNAIRSAERRHPETSVLLRHPETQSVEGSRAFTMSLIAILFFAIAAFAAPKSASAYYADAAFQYIENRLPSAEITCNEGLQQYPNDQKLQMLLDRIKEAKDEQKNENKKNDKNQDNNDQNQNDQNQNQDQNQDKNNQDQNKDQQNQQNQDQNQNQNNDQSSSSSQDEQNQDQQNQGNQGQSSSSNAQSSDSNGGGQQQQPEQQPETGSSDSNGSDQEEQQQSLQPGELSPEEAAQLLKDFDEQNGERKPWKPVRGQVRPAKDW